MSPKNEETCKLTGERRQRDVSERLERMRAISKRCAKSLREGEPPIDHGELLYDERGLPKETEAGRKLSLDEVWPAHSVAVWPEGLSLRREDIYEDRI